MGGSNLRILNTSSPVFPIDITGVTGAEIRWCDAEIGDVTTTFGGSINVDCNSTESSIIIEDNFGFSASLTGTVETTFRNNYGTSLSLESTGVGESTITGNTYARGISINVPGGVVCRFSDNTSAVASHYWQFGEPYVVFESGKNIVEGCGGDAQSPYNLSMFTVNGGIVDFGGGPLGSIGDNDLTGLSYVEGIYYIYNDTPNNTYAIGNTWDSGTANAMQGHYYDTYDIYTLYDKWENPSVGFVIWSEPDPNGPVPAFDLLAPANGEIIAETTPTLDWQDMPACPWITFGHFDLYVDTDPYFGNPDVYANLTSSQYTFSSVLPDGTYYWKVLAFDNGGHSRWSEQTDWSFTIESGQLGDFSLLSPENGETLLTLRPAFDWEDADPTRWQVPGNAYSNRHGFTNDKSMNSINDMTRSFMKSPGFPMKDTKAITLDHYELYLDTDSGFSNPTVISDITESTYSLDYDLEEDETYYWKVKAVDNLGREKWCDELDWWFYIDIPSGIKSASLGQIKALYK